MKDYEVIHTMSEGYGNRFAKQLDAVVSAMNNKHYDMLNIEVVKTKVTESIRALEMKMRFDSLSTKASGKLVCTNSGFELDGHKFETLDEVERALNNKAFL